MKPAGFKLDSSRTQWVKKYASYAAASTATKKLKAKGYRANVNQIGQSWRVVVSPESTPNPRKPAARQIRGKSKVSPRRPVGRGRQRTANGRGRQRNRNPGDEGRAEVLREFEGFHGRASGGMQERNTTLQLRQDFSKCGRLIDIGVWLDEDKFLVLKPKSVDVATTGDGGSLYFLGGDQELPIVALGLADFLPKDYIKVGEVQSIAYHTEKGFHNFKPTDYEHEFAEDGGELPTLNYDTINKLLFLTGGSYQVRPEGIIN